MSARTTYDASALRRLLRYLAGSLDVELRLSLESELNLDMPLEVQAVSDALWAPSPDRRSTSGGTLWLCGFLLRGYAATQVVLACSSCEAELYGLNTVVQQACLARSILTELGATVTITAYSDSTGTCAVTGRRTWTSSI